MKKICYFVENIGDYNSEEHYTFLNLNDYQEFLLSLYEEYVFANENIRYNWYNYEETFEPHYLESFNNTWYYGESVLIMEG